MFAMIPMMLLSSCYAAQGLVIVSASDVHFPHQQNGPAPGERTRLSSSPLTASDESLTENSIQRRTPEFGSRSNRNSRVLARKRRCGDAWNPKPPGVALLKRTRRWACVKNCGACCYLAPDKRGNVQENMEDDEEVALYLSMIDDDGWCKHYDKDNRACTIYDDRPRFCRVEPEIFGDMFGVQPGEMDDFCSGCCRAVITDAYGCESEEMKTFNNALAALASGGDTMPETRPFANMKHTWRVPRP